MRNVRFLATLSLILLLVSCRNGTDVPVVEKPVSKPESVTVTGVLSEKISADSSVRDSIVTIFDTPASDCQSKTYLSRARVVVDSLIPKEVPASARPSDSVLSNECLLRAAVRAGECASLKGAYAKDCQDLLPLKKAVSEGKDPLKEQKGATLYVRYYLDGKTYPPEKYLR